MRADASLGTNAAVSSAVAQSPDASGVLKPDRRIQGSDYWRPDELLVSTRLCAARSRPTKYAEYWLRRDASLARIRFREHLLRLGGPKCGPPAGLPPRDNQTCWSPWRALCET